MNQIETEMTKHLETFPERRRELLEFQKKTMEEFGEIKKQIKDGLRLGFFFGAWVVFVAALLAI